MWLITWWPCGFYWFRWKLQFPIQRVYLYKSCITDILPPENINKKTPKKQTAFGETFFCLTLSEFSDLCKDILDASCTDLPELATYALTSRGNESSHIHKSVSHTAGWTGWCDDSIACLSSIPFLLIPDPTHILWRAGEKSQKAHVCRKQVSFCFNLIIARWIGKSSSTQKIWKIHKKPVLVLEWLSKQKLTS